MKKLIFLFLISSMAWVACTDDDDFRSEGVITGLDARRCVCCGGWFIDIGPETYRFYELPSGSDLDLQNADFPVEVELDWHKDPDACLGDEIIVEEIELDD